MATVIQAVNPHDFCKYATKNCIYVCIKSDTCVLRQCILLNTGLVRLWQVFMMYSASYKVENNPLKTDSTNYDINYVINAIYEG